MIQISKAILGLDFESYFDDRYTLDEKRGDKLTMTEYVRDERFELHGVGVRWKGQHRAMWYRGKAMKAFFTKLKARKSPWGLLCHNTAFDGLVLSEHFDIVPDFYFDTLSMARPLYSNEIGAGLDEVSRFLGFIGKTSDIVQRTKGKHWDEFTPTEKVEMSTYCLQDVDEMWRIFWHMLKEEQFPADELRLIHLTIAAFARPLIRVDGPRVKKHLEVVRKRNSELFRKVARLVGFKPYDEELFKKLLRSNDKYAAELRRVGLEPPMKNSPTQKDETGIAPKKIYAFAKADLDFQALAGHPDKRIRMLFEARLLAKSSIEETRSLRMLSHSNEGKIALPIKLNYSRAHTLRWSGGDKMNPQNLPRGGELRRSLVAPPGHRVVVVDSGQIEDRMNCKLAGQDDVIETYRLAGIHGKKKHDPYREMAAEIYQKKASVIKDDERMIGKIARLGLGYGMGPPKFWYTVRAGTMGPPMDISMELAEKAVYTYRARSDKIVRRWKFLEGLILQMYFGRADYNDQDILHFFSDQIQLPNGLELHYKNIKGLEDPISGRVSNFSYQSGKHTRSKLYGGLLDENIIQTLSRIVVGEQMLVIAERYPVVTMSHDEVVYLCHWREATRAYNFGVEALSTPPTWLPDIPLAADGGVDVNYSK